MILMTAFPASGRVRAALWLLGWALLPSSSPGAPVAPHEDTRPRSEASAEKTRKALEQTISLDFADQRLDQAIAHLREQTKLTFILDRATIQQMGVDPEESLITFKVENGKL